MGKLRAIGWVVFLALAAVGAKQFMDWKKKDQAEHARKALAYFSSLVRQDTSGNMGYGPDGKPIQAWVLAENPTQLQIEEKVGPKAGLEDEWLLWKYEYDPTGGDQPKPLEFRAKFDSQGNLELLRGVHGTVGRSPGEWKPE